MDVSGIITIHANASTCAVLSKDLHIGGSAIMLKANINIPCNVNFYLTPCWNTHITVQVPVHLIVSKTIRVRNVESLNKTLHIGAQGSLTAVN